MENLLMYRSSPSSTPNGLGFGIGLGGRSSSASSAERSLLLGALATHLGVLDARENDSQTIIRKSELWDEITRQFNVQAGTPRSRQQIQTLYKNMKAKARRYEARLAEVNIGVPPPDPDPISEMLLGLLHQQLQHQRRTLHHHLTALDPHNANHSAAALHENHTKASHAHMEDTTLITPEQVMQVSMEEGTSPETEVKDEPRDEEEEFNPGSDSGPDTFPDHALVDSRTRQLEVFTSRGESPADGNSQHKQLLSDMKVENETNHNLHQNPLAAVLASPFGNRNSILNHQHIPTTISTMQQITSQNLVPSTPVLVQSPTPTATIEHPSLEFQSPSKRPRLDIMTEVPRVAIGSVLGASRHPSTSSHSIGSVLGSTRSPNTSSYSTCCACPDLHASLLAFSRQEHRLRESMLLEERQMRHQEHQTKMSILRLKEQMLRSNLKNIQVDGVSRHSCSEDEKRKDGCDVNDKCDSLQGSKVGSHMEENGQDNYKYFEEMSNNQEKEDLYTGDNVVCNQEGIVENGKKVENETINNKCVSPSDGVNGDELQDDGDVSSVDLL